MDHPTTACGDCPFQRHCPLKSHVDSPCIIGRNPMKAYMSVWFALVAGSFFIS